MAKFDLVDFDMTRSPGRTYRYFTGEAQFEFGYGLNPLTQFRLETIAVTAKPPREETYGTKDLTSCAKKVTVCVTMRNIGNRAGDEVVMAYLIPQDIPVTEPASKLRKQLFAFERIHLISQQAQDVCFEIDQEVVSLYDDYGMPRVFPGRYIIRLDTGIEAIEQPVDVQVTTRSTNKSCFYIPKTLLGMDDVSLQ